MLPDDHSYNGEDDSFTSTELSDTDEGSLVDFIEHDTDDGESDYRYESSSSEISEMDTESDKLCSDDREEEDNVDENEENEESEENKNWPAYLFE